MTPDRPANAGLRPASFVDLAGTVCGTRALLALLAMLLWTAPTVAEEFWSVVEQGGRKVGHAHYERRIEAGEIITRDELEIRVIAGLGMQDVRVERETREREDGTPSAFSLQLFAGVSKLAASARISGGQILVTQRIGDRVLREHMPLPPAMMLRSAVEQRISQQDPDHDWRLEFDELDLASLSFQRVTIKPDAPGTAGPVLLHREVDRNGRRQSSLLTWMIGEKRFVESWNLWSHVFVLRGSDRETALSKSEPFDVLQDMTLASPYRIPVAARGGTIRYVFERLDGPPVTLAATSEQSVRYQGSRTVVTICRDCGTEAPPDKAQLDRYRQPNPWVQSDHPRIRALAREAPLRGSVNAKMRALAHQVERHMTGAIDYLGYASALDALDSRSGDCSEFALLLAALGRASGIPTRVVAGLAYASRFTGRHDVFSPHMWVQSWDGSRWRSYDAGLGQFDSGHIALVVGDGAPLDFENATTTVQHLRLVQAGRITSQASLESPPKPR